MAYPTWAPEHWQEVAAFYGQWSLASVAHQFAGKVVTWLTGTITDLAGLSIERHQQLEELVNSEVPMIFDSFDGHPTFGVTVGQRAYEVRTDPEFLQSMSYAHPNKISQLVCVQGCGASGSSDTSVLSLKKKSL